METLTIVLLGISIVVNVILGIIIRNFLVKEKKWATAFDVQVNWMKNLSDEIRAGQQHLFNLDQKGVFQSDDEVGFFFEQMKKVQTALSKYVIPEEYGKEKVE